jgi:putative ABC transport system permease protein
LVAPLLLLFAAAFTFVFLDTSLVSVERSLGEYYAQTRFADYRAAGGRTEELAARARRLDGVAVVETRTTVTLAVWARGGKVKLQGQLVGVRTAPPSVDGYLVEQGHGIDLERPHRVLIDTHTAEGLDLGPGARLRILGLGAVQDVRVRGVVSSPEYVVAAASAQQLVTAPGQFAVVFAPESFVARAAGAQGLTEVLVRYAPAASTARLDRELAALAAETDAVVREPRADQPSNAMVQAELEGLRVARLLVPGILGLLALTLGGLALVHAASAGSSPRHILIGGSIAGELGAVAGLAVAWASAESVADRLGIPVSEVTVGVGGLVIALVLSAATVGLASIASRVAIGARHRRIGGMALAGIAAALAVTAVLAPLGVLDSAEATLERAARVETVDAQIVFNVPVGPEQLRELTDVRGVAVAEPVPSAVVAVGHGNRRYSTQLEAFRPESRLARFETPDGDPQPIPRRGLLLPSALADILDARPGDPIELAVPGVATVSMPMAARTSDALGNLVFTSIPALRAALDAPPGTFAGGLFNVAAARFAPDADATRIAREVTASSTVATYVDVAADLDTFVGELPLLELVSWILFGIGAGLALLGFLVAATAVVPGARDRRQLVVDLVVPGAVGALVGVLLGAGAAALLVDGLQTPVVRLQTSLDPASVGITMVVVILVDAVIAVLARPRDEVDLAGG